MKGEEGEQGGEGALAKIMGEGTFSIYQLGSKSGLRSMSR